jgi:protein-disulfide isomerase
MKVFLGIMSLLSLFVVSSCSESNGKPNYLFKQAPKEGLAAKIGDMEVTNAELVDGIESEIYEAESKLFEVKFNRLKSLLLQKYMDRDTRKKGLTNDQYLEKYVTNNVNISEKEIDAFIANEKIPAEHLTPEVRGKIKDYLSIERKKQAVDRWIAEQTKKTPVEVYVAKPRRPTYPVEAGNAPFSGNKDAKVTIVEYSDFQCPYCSKGAEILKEIKKKYGDKIKVVFKNFPLPFHNHAEQAAVAGLCANEQGTNYFWKMHDEMFAAQDSLDAEGLKNTAKKVGLKPDQFEKCLAENKYLSQVKTDMEEGRKVRVKSTPTFFINGQLIMGAQPLDVFSEIIEEEMAR